MRFILPVVFAVLAGCARLPSNPLADAGAGEGGGGPGPRADADPRAPDAGPNDPPPLIGCETVADAAQPFANHAHSYAPGAILPSHVSQAELDDAVRQYYATWKGAYLRAGCGDARTYVAVGFDDSITVSEAHGYGMIIAAYMAGHDPDAKRHFDGLFRYFRDHPSVGDPALMSWSQDHGCNDNNGGHSASDGDLDIAYALLLADKQWGSGGAIDYYAEAGALIDAIARAEVDDSGSWILLGDWAVPGNDYYYDATRSSDFMPGHLASFEAVVGDGGWQRLMDRAYAMVATLQSSHAPATGLLPDFIRFPADDPTPADASFLERPVDGEYSFNACRVPLRLGIHYLTTGDSRARTALQKINTWLRADAGDNPANITAGYWRDGDSLPGSGYLSMAFVAPFAVGAMVDGGNQVWLNNLWDTVRWRDLEHTYYGDTLKLLAMLALSGNWWAPEAAPCPD